MISAKPLPRDQHGQIKREFKANGNKYTILTPSECMTPHRQNWLEKLTNEWLFGSSAETIAAKINQIGAKIHELGHEAEGRYFVSTELYCLQAGLLNRSKQKYSRSLYIATLFIVKNGEDTRNWTMEAAKQKIDDWNTEGYTAHDFFLLSTSLLRPITAQLKKDLDNLPKSLAPMILDELQNTASDTIMENLSE